mmetsp:Transcript_47947/g.147973  ORF Transcript_47947/g.147973 Transcript_47947/m.147973 type:complete len:202 (+) Transcript_47947:1516-2121(+)
MRCQQRDRPPVAVLRRLGRAQQRALHRHRRDHARCRERSSVDRRGSDVLRLRRLRPRRVRQRVAGAGGKPLRRQRQHRQRRRRRRQLDPHHCPHLRHRRVGHRRRRRRGDWVPPLPERSPRRGRCRQRPWTPSRRGHQPPRRRRQRAVPRGAARVRWLWSRGAADAGRPDGVPARARRAQGRPQEQPSRRLNVHASSMADH